MACFDKHANGEMLNQPAQMAGGILLNKIYGGHSEEVTPVPFPNTEVKLFSADGTAWETVWESRSPPVIFLQTPARITPGWGFFFFTSLIPILDTSIHVYYKS